MNAPRLYPYQRRWVEDEARFKIACKARQIGFTFAAAWRVVDKRLRRPGLTVWLSASERQALEAMEHIRRFAHELRVAAILEEQFVRGTLVKLYTVRFPNRSRIVALPANPDTVRGFAGDVVLDEFAFHRDADAIWRAAFATATRGFQIEIISTPNGTRGKFYELARATALVDFTPHPEAEEAGGTFLKKGVPRTPSKDFYGDAAAPLGGGPSASRQKVLGERENTFSKGFSQLAPPSGTIWSAHWVDLSLARAQGFVVDVESLRAAIDDEDAWQQEYCCRFLPAAAHYLPPELVVAAEHPAATTALPFPVTGDPRPVAGSSPPVAARWPPATSSYLGVDIGRHRDLTVLWLLAVENESAPPEARIYWTRGVVALERAPFTQQRATLDAFLALRLTAQSELCENPFEKGFSHSPKTFYGDADGPASGGAAASRQKSLEGGRGEPFFRKVSPQSPGYAIRRCAVDASGLGAMLAEELQQRWGSRVEPIVFTLAVKEDLAVRVKRLLEDGRLRIPHDPAVRAALAAVKRYVTPAGNVRFDADRTERAGHADHFWALALALAAADEPAPTIEFVSSNVVRPSAHSSAF